MTTRTFHVEITFTKTVEVKVEDAEVFESQDELKEFVQDEALLNSGREECLVDDDYQIETVKEVTAAEKSA